MIYFLFYANSMEIPDQIAEFAKSHHYITYEYTDAIILANIIDDKQDEHVSLEIHCDNIYNNSIYIKWIRAGHDRFMRIYCDRVVDFITLIYQSLIDDRMASVASIAKREKIAWSH